MNKRLVFLLFAVILLFSSVFVPTDIAKAVGVFQKITPVSGGMPHTIALKDDGTIWTWGSNQQLQLGSAGNVTEQPLPAQVEDISSVISVSAGYYFSLALRYDGSVYVLGTGGSSPVYKVPGLTGIVAVAAGQTEGLALDIDGALWQWDIGGSPRRISRLSGVAAIEAGGAHFFALTFSGDVWAWGANWSGQLGIGSTNDLTEPRRIPSLANIVSIAAGYSHSLAVSHDGSVYAWGSNTYGQLGDGTTETRYSPVKVIGVENAVQASAGNESSMALTSKHEIYTWGYGEYGQLGNGTTTITQDTPSKIEVKGAPDYIASGAHHCLYVADTGDLYAWGRNRNHQLGSGMNSNESSPVKVSDALASASENNTNPLTGASNWAPPELSKLYAMNLLPPMLWGNYRENVTRAEFAAVLVNMYETLNGTSIKFPDKTNFTDIENHVFEAEIRKAFEIELVSGVSETSFNPRGSITRQEAAKMICSFIVIMEDIPLDMSPGSLAFYKDAASISEWAVPFVRFAYVNDIMQGSGGSFNPLSNLTREMTLAMIYRIILKYGWV